MDESQLFEQFQDLQRYIGWTDGDSLRMRQLRPLVAPHFIPIIDDFYQEIERHPRANHVIRGGPAQVARLHQTLRNWLDQLFAGEYDAVYVARRWQVGRRHVEIGLEQQYANVALGRIRSKLIAIVCGQWSGTHDELLAVVQSINRALDLDLAIIEDAYQFEHVQRQKRAERLIAIGQMAGGIAHELRNPLNVVRTSVFYLRNARQVTPEKLDEHLQRIERQVVVADGVISALSDFAKLPIRQDQTISLSELTADLIKNLTVPENVVVVPPADGRELWAIGDFRQLLVVLNNLVRNAIDAMPNGGQVTIGRSAENGRVKVTVTDTGPGIAATELQRIFEPFYTTKVRGIGLGLAISRAIVENHRGELSVTSQPGTGCCFTVSLASSTAPEAAT